MRNYREFLPVLTVLTLLSTSPLVRAKEHPRAASQDCESLLDTLGAVGIKEVIDICRDVIRRIDDLEKGGCDKNLTGEFRRMQELIAMAEEQVAEHHEDHNLLEAMPFWLDLKSRLADLQKKCNPSPPPTVRLSKNTTIDPFFGEILQKAKPPKPKLKRPRIFFKRRH